jgi:lipoate-protein ligase A
LIEKDKGLDGESRRNPVCFENPSAYELTVQGKKLIGSAQVRRQHAMLQHGTLPLTGDLGRICDVLQFDSQNSRERARMRLENQAGTVQLLLGHEVSWSQANRAIQQGFRQAFDLQLVESQPTEGEQQRMQELVRARYANPTWTERL